METEHTTPLHVEDGLKEKVRNNEEAVKQMKEIETRKESLHAFKMKCLTGSDVIALFISLFHSHHGCLRVCIVWFFDGLHQEERMN